MGNLSTTILGAGPVNHVIGCSHELSISTIPERKSLHWLEQQQSRLTQIQPQLETRIKSITRLDLLGH